MKEATRKAARQLQQVEQALSRVVFGQGNAVRLALATALADGHGLIVGPPGVAKTRLVQALARVLGLGSGRVQFTPDLMPADITGSEVMDDLSGRKSLRFLPGPLFAPMVLADEINRASPRTQSALLQAMQERQVTVGGATHDLPAPFLVFATQNPLESEGVFPLPEAQLDRFMTCIDMGFADAAAERHMLIHAHAGDIAALHPVLDAMALRDLRDLAHALPVGDSVLDGIVQLTRNLRPSGTASPLRWGPGSRGAQALLALARAQALIDGRAAPSLDDIIALAPAALGHRMALTYAAEASGVRIRDLIDQATARL